MKPCVVESWLEGKIDEPSTELEAANSGSRLDRTEYWYGVYRTPRGKIASFLSKHRENVPMSALVVRHGVGHAKVQAAVQEILSMSLAVESVPDEPRVRPLVPGALATLSDPDGVHVGAIVDLLGDDVFMVILTSRPRWNPQARRASSDDVAALGGFTSRTSYLAPVVRSRQHVYLRDGELSRQRLKELQSAFDWDAARRV